MSEGTIPLAAGAAGVEGNEGQVTEPQVDAGGESGGESGGHPAWGKVYEDLYQVLPEGFQEPVKSRLDKHFSEWDKNYQQSLQKVQSEYQPWEPIVKSGVNPNQAQAALQLYYLAESRPEVLYQQLKAFHGFDSDQGQAQNGSGEEEFDLGNAGEQQPLDLAQHPQFQQVAQQTQQIEQFIAAQAAQQAQAEADAALDRDIQALSAKYGEDVVGNPQAMNYILTQTHLMGLQNPGVDPTTFLDKAAQQYTELIGSVRSAPRASDSAPIVMSGGGVPALAKNPADLSDSERRAAMVQMLGSLSDS